MELELQAVVRHIKWVLGAKLGSFAAVVLALSHWPSPPLILSLHPILFLLYVITLSIGFGI